MLRYVQSDKIARIVTTHQLHVSCSASTIANEKCLHNDYNSLNIYEFKLGLYKTKTVYLAITNFVT